MKTKAWWIVAALICAPQLQFAQAPQNTGVVKSLVVNVRGQPSIFSEVVTQLKQGDQVTILEEIAVEKPKPEDIAKWMRIQMPANTPVWAHASFINTNSEVRVRRLNLRAGPGENYSVVGLLEQGDKVKEIRRKDNWIEIEPSEKAYAFIAADLVERETASIASAPVKDAEPTPAKDEPAVPVPAADAVKKPESAMTNQLETVQITNEVARVAAVTSTNAPLPPTLASPPELTKTPPSAKLPASTPPALKKIAEPLPRRVVIREGVIRGTISIQAPTDYLLESPYNGVTMNYLYPTSTNIVLKNFRGRRVVVTGEEAMDVRWPNTPVLKVESLKPAPSKGE